MTFTLLGTVLAPLGVSWATFGAVLGHLVAAWPPFGPRGSKRDAQEQPKRVQKSQQSSPREAQQDQEGPRETPRSPREAQETPKEGPKDSQRVRRSPRKHPRQDKKASRKQKYKKAAQHSSTKEPLSIELPRRGSRSAYNLPTRFMLGTRKLLIQLSQFKEVHTLPAGPKNAIRPTTLQCFEHLPRPATRSMIHNNPAEE